MSLGREACLTVSTDSLAVIAADKRARYGIVRIPVARLAALYLTVTPVHIDAVPGHVVIPEPNSAAFLDQANKEFFTATELRQAEIASDNIAHQPATE